MLEILNSIRSCLRIFCISLIAIIILPIAAVIIILLCTPHIIYRKCLFYLAPLLKPELGKMLNLTAMIIPSFYEDPKYGTVVYEMEIDGEINLNQFRNDFCERILDKKNLKGSFVYPEFKQNIVKWMGHLFFKDDKDFQVEEHIKPWIKSELSNSGKNSEEVNRIRKEISIEDFRSDKPYWIIYTLFDAESQKTLLFLKQHHSYFDGLSTLYLFMNFLNCKFPKSAKNDRILSKFQRIPHIFVKLWRAFYIAAENLIYSLESDQEWKRDVTPEEFLKNGTIKDLHSQIFHIPFEKLRRASISNNVNVSSIVLAGISGGIRQYQLKHGLKFNGNPIFGVTIPRPGHPKDKLRNHVFATYLPTPICIPDARDRLQMIFHSWEKMKDSYYSDFIHFMAITIYMNFPPSRLRFYNKLMVTHPPFLTFYSGLPGPKEKMLWREKEFKFTAFYKLIYPFHTGGMPILIDSISNSLGINFSIYGGFPSEDSIRELSSFIEAEVDELMNTGNKACVV